MKSQSTIQQQLRRFAAVLVVIAALTVVALAPALLASQLITQDGGESTATGHIDHAASIDVTDVDQDGTVMYTVSPPQDWPADLEFDFPTGLLEDSDVIRLTISDQVSHPGLSKDSVEEECEFTLYFSDSDKHDEKTGTYTGYLRIRDDEMGPYVSHSNDPKCGFVITYVDETRK